MSSFRKAERTADTKLRIGMFGYGGSGKTFTALLVARGLVGDGRIAVLHTEGDAIDLYADNPAFGEFFVFDIEPPYTVEKFIAGIQAAAKEGMDCVIIDSLSAEWSGKGGLLEKKDASGQQGLQAWAPIKGEHRDLLAYISRPPVPVICTFRARQNNKQVKEGGKTVIVKEGDKPDSEYTTEYEFDVWLELDQTHRATVHKDRTGQLDKTHRALTAQDGRKLADWLASGAPVKLDGVYVDGEVAAGLNLLGYPLEKHADVIKQMIGKADPTKAGLKEKLLDRINAKLNTTQGE